MEITETEYTQLLYSHRKLRALERNCVSHWVGYYDALEDKTVFNGKSFRDLDRECIGVVDTRIYRERHERYYTIGFDYDAWMSKIMGFVK